MQLVVGVLVDRYRVRWVLVVAVLMCALGALLFGASNSYWVAATGRLLQGAGSAFAFVGALKLAAIWLPQRHFAKASGMVNCTGFVGAGLSEIFLTKMTNSIGWQHTLWYLAALGELLAAVILLTIRLKKSGTATLQHKINTLRQSIANLGNAFKQPFVWLAGLYACCLFLPTSVFAALWGIPYIEVAHHYSPTKAATVVSAIFIGWAIGAAVSGILSDILRKRALLLRIGALLACGLSVLLIYDLALPFPIMWCLFLSFGIVSALQPLAFVVAKDRTKSAHAVGSVIALVNALTMVGGLIFQRGVGLLMDSDGVTHVVHGVPVYTLLQYQHALLVIPISLGLGFLVSLMIKDKLDPRFYG